MKKNKSTIIMLLFFFMGLIILLYPSISNYYNEKVQSKAVLSYEEQLKNYKEEDYTAALKQANDYNNQLKKIKDPLINYKKLKNYQNILNVNNNGMIGYLAINKIGVELPIYHGTSNDVLNKAVGHLEGTSIPVGGIGTHSVLSAHRGLPSFKLFTDLDKLEVGDRFTITVLNKKITYEIDKITIVKPNEIDELKIDANKDYVTLLTCTPYGINSHRLLVRGSRIEVDDAKSVYITTECYKISNLITMPLVALPIILTLLLMIVLSPIETGNELQEYLNQIKNKRDIKKEGRKDE